MTETTRHQIRRNGYCAAIGFGVLCLFVPSMWFGRVVFVRPEHVIFVGPPLYGVVLFVVFLFYRQNCDVWQAQQERATLRQHMMGCFKQLERLERIAQNEYAAEQQTLRQMEQALDRGDLEQAELRYGSNGHGEKVRQG